MTGAAGAAGPGSGVPRLVGACQEQDAPEERDAYQDPRLASVYQRGNEMPATSLRAWAELIAGYASGGRAVLEVGAGTGMFCAALAEVLPDAEVTGVEPSAPMLAEAQRHNAHPRVRYLAGSAQALPMPDAGVDLVLLSRVVHHLPDRPAAARELARALRPGGRLVIRTTVRERLDAPVYRYWPRLLETDAERFPSERQIVEDFTSAADFAVHRVHSFSRPTALDLREWRERIAGRAQSKFLALTEAEFAAGLARLDAELARGSGGGGGGVADCGGGVADGGAVPRGAVAPVEERYDVIVLERTPVGA